MDELPLPWPEFREVWRPIPGFDGYEVSTAGRVKSHIVTRGRSEGRLLSATLDTCGYYKYILAAGGRRHNRTAHRLVVLAFFGAERRNTRQHTRHLDGNIKNNSVNNLHLGTAKENVEDSRRHGTLRRSPGEQNGRATVTEAIVRDIRQRVSQGEKRRDVAAKAGVSLSLVHSVASRRTWKHVG